MESYMNACELKTCVNGKTFIIRAKVKTVLAATWKTLFHVITNLNCKYITIEWKIQGGHWKMTDPFICNN